MRPTWYSKRSRRTRRWRGLGVAVGVLMLAVGVLGGATLLPRIMPEPPSTLDRGTAALVDGRLVITNPDGSVTVIDVSEMGPPGQAQAKVLLASNAIYVTNHGDGTVTRLDPTDGSAVEPVWTCPTPIRDAVVDGADTLWVLCEADLHSLTWTDTGLTPAREPVAMPGAGEGSWLVWHTRGVTAIIEETQQAWRIGTNIDGSVPLPDRCPGLTVPVYAPAYNVPVACDGGLMIIGSSTAITVDPNVHGCATPGSTSGLDKHVVVTCEGAGKALLFDAGATDTPREIVLGTSGDPQLSYGQGRTILALPGGSNAILEWDGTLSGVPSGLAGGIGQSPDDHQTSTKARAAPPGEPPEEPEPPVDPLPSDEPELPIDPPPPPRNGDDVIVSISGPHDVPGATNNYNVSPPAECQIDPYAYYPPEYLQALGLYCYGQPTVPVTYTVTEVHRQYTAHLALPDNWKSFAATCTLVVTGSVISIDPREFDCQDDSDVLISYGDGQEWSVVVKAYDASGISVTSKAEPLTTLGSYTCYSSASGTTCS